MGLNNFELARSNQNEHKVESVSKISNKIENDKLFVWIDYMKNIYVRSNTRIIYPKWGITPKQIELVNECLIISEQWKGNNIKDF